MSIYSKKDDEQLEKFWDELKYTVPIDENNCIKIDWEVGLKVWIKGTHLDKIFDWFDKYHSKGLGYLIYDYK